MLKLLFWGLIGYVVYRYFQMKEQLKEGRRREYVHQQQPPPKQEASPDKQKNEGEFIDYEEVK
jgi:hypothetical protein